MRISFKTLLISFLVSIFLPLSMAHASSAPKKEEAEAGPPYVRLSSVAIPVFENQSVVNYIFLTVRLNLTAKADVNKLREKEPYFRNQLMQAAYKTSFALPDKSDTLDEARFKKVMIGEFSQVSGAGMIQSIEILDQNPKRRRR
ncbi:hypothetical protein Q1W73_12520 [Asticcacaulis sp. ZE23SCel15]|uniref:hypothetical protein n=1 Tax=Asticcacaulis sp. ZE23SCel15 TaxID=3059027 RepID=UPI00265DAC19|nr:hypothetical protein [Asticcacaulis sp. ZE23SCel15]WKL56508.1 hypothetical protein Q1W73_12520 [Asticcacaulis sp. ZE23SCel15]